MPILTYLILLPLLGAVLVAISPTNLTKYYKWFTLIISIIGLGLSIYLYLNFDESFNSYQFLEKTDWITLSLGNLGVLSIDYILGVDGISMPLVVLAAIIQVIGSLASFEINTKTKGYFSIYLLLSAAVMGCFLALDFFLFFLFFEFMLLPMYFLIGIWGGKNKEYASIKFFIYTLVGSIFILLVMIGLSISAIDPIATAEAIGVLQNNMTINAEVIAGIQKLLSKAEIPAESLVHTFDFRHLSDASNYLPDSFLNMASQNFEGQLSIRNIAFLLLFIGFAIKLPLVPFHTWLPDAHVEAPTAISVVLAGTLLKIGGYGFIRIAYSIFPDSAAHYAYWIAFAGAFSIIWGAYNALAQKDFKRQIAYSSVSHMGFVVIGIASITAEGVSGAIFQMFSHGILSAMLFLIVGSLYSRTGNRQISDFQGIAQKMPLFTVFVAIAFFASLGLPALSGFIGEFFSMMGSFNSIYYPKYITAVASLGIVIGAAYFLWTFKRMFLGVFWSKNENSQLQDLNLREIIMYSFLAIITLALGVLPHLVFNKTNPTVIEFIKLFQN